MIQLDEYTGLYFFSALFQGNAALLAILGVFVIYKLQDLKNNVANVRTTLMTIGHLMGFSSDRYPIVRFDFSSISEKEPQVGLMPPLLQDYFRRWISYEKSIRTLAASITWPTISLGLIVAIGLLGMIFATHLHLYFSGAEFVILSFVAIWDILSIAIVIVRILNLLRE